LTPRKSSTIAKAAFLSDTIYLRVVVCLEHTQNRVINKRKINVRSFKSSIFVDGNGGRD